MAVARARFAGTHLENAPQWLLEIEALTMGGWSLKPAPRVREEDGVARHRDGPGRESGPERARSAPLKRQVSRIVRIAEPRAAPRPVSAVRHHHFEQKIILASAKGTISVAERRAAYGEGFNAADAIIPPDVRATNEAAYAEGHKSTEAEIGQNIDTWQLWRKRKKKQLSDATEPLRQGLERLRTAARDPALPHTSRRQIQGQLDRGELVLADMDALTDTAVHAAMLRHMIRSGPDATIAHYSAVDEAVGRKPVTPARAEKRVFARRVCEAAQTHIAALEPTLQQLAQTQEAAIAKLKEARAALRKFLPKVEADIGQALAKSPAPAPSGIKAIAPPAMPPRARQALAAHLASGRSVSG